MEARKDNKVYQVDKTEADAYAAAGYDIYDKGKLVKHAAGKTVPIAQYEALEAEVKKLKAELKKAKG